MGEWDDYDVIVTLQEWNSVTELALVDKITLTTDCASQSVTFDLAFEHLIEIVDVEATRIKVVLLRLLLFILLLVFMPDDLSLLRQVITDRIEVPLVHIDAFSNVTALIR